MLISEGEEGSRFQFVEVETPFPNISDKSSHESFFKWGMVTDQGDTMQFAKFRFNKSYNKF